MTALGCASAACLRFSAAIEAKRVVFAFRESQAAHNEHMTCVLLRPKLRASAWCWRKTTMTPPSSTSLVLAVFWCLHHPGLRKRRESRDGDDTGLVCAAPSLPNCVIGTTTSRAHRAAVMCRLQDDVDIWIRLKHSTFGSFLFGLWWRAMYSINKSWPTTHDLDIFKTNQTQLNKQYEHDNNKIPASMQSMTYF